MFSSLFQITKEKRSYEQRKVFVCFFFNFLCTVEIRTCGISDNETPLHPNLNIQDENGYRSIVIKGSRIIIQYARRACFVYIRLISYAQIKIVIKPNKYKVEEH